MGARRCRGRSGSGDGARQRRRHSKAPPEVVVETPGVRVASSEEVSWRIRPKQAFSGRLTVKGGAERVEIPGRVSPGCPGFFGDFRGSALITPRILEASGGATADAGPHQRQRRQAAGDLISIDTLRADHLSAMVIQRSARRTSMPSATRERSSRRSMRRSR